MFLFKCVVVCVVLCACLSGEEGVGGGGLFHYHHCISIWNNVNTEVFTFKAVLGRLCHFYVYYMPFPSVCSCSNWTLPPARSTVCVVDPMLCRQGLCALEAHHNWFYQDGLVSLESTGFCMGVDCYDWFYLDWLRAAEEMDRLDEEMRETIRRLWSVQGRKMLDLLMPSVDGQYFTVLHSRRRTSFILCGLLSRGAASTVLLASTAATPTWRMAA